MFCRGLLLCCAESSGAVWREPLGRHNGGGWLELVVVVEEVEAFFCDVNVAIGGDSQGRGYNE